MISIERTLGNLGDVIITGTVMGSLGAFIGYSVAKLSDLPPAQVTKGWAICFFALSVLVALTKMIDTSELKQKIISETGCIIIDVIWIKEMRQRGLMGDKMMYFTMTWTALIIYNAIHNIFKLKNSVAN